MLTSNIDATTLLIPHPLPNVIAKEDNIKGRLECQGTESQGKQNYETDNSSKQVTQKLVTECQDR